MPLPTKKTLPKSELSDLTLVVYGGRKYGKSTFCSNMDMAYFLATEQGLNSLETFNDPITTWEELLAKAAEIAAGGHPFRTIVIDIVDNAYKMCSDYICAKFKVNHPSDLAYGKGQALVNNEFQRVLNKLAALPYGLVLVSHSQEIEIDSPTGKYTRTVPTLPNKAREIVLGMADMILYCDIEIEEAQDGTKRARRVIRTKPNKFFEAGDRTGRMPEVLDLDYAQFARMWGESVKRAKGSNGSNGTNGTAGTTATAGAANGKVTGPRPVPPQVSGAATAQPAAK